MGGESRTTIEDWLRARAPERAPRGRFAPGATVGGWRVEAFLGAGLSSEVYRVKNARFGHEGALKILTDPSRGLKDRFLAELDALRFLSLPALPRFLDCGVSGGAPYYVMEHLQPLPDPLPRADIPRFICRTAKAVHALHDAGYVHRDLKPGNLLRRRNGNPVLIDLGLIRKRGAGPDSVGAGTVDYAAPEQLLKGVSSVQSDVFSLGKLLWALYDGRPPRNLKGVIRRATRERPGDRYPTAAAFAAAVRHRRRPACALFALTALALAGAAFGVTHRHGLARRVVALLSPPAPVIVHEQRANEADADYFARMSALAARGDVLAQIAVAEAHFYGRGTATNQTEAVAWYRRAAETGDADAQASLGLCLFRGRGCERNLDEAAVWYAKSAAQGNLGAMNDLAFCLLNGFGVEKDPEQGFAWALKAAERGHAASQTLVGECYLDGLGTEVDVGRGETWLYRAARQDNKRAQMLLRNR